jgi:hypothetical protein
VKKENGAFKLRVNPDLWAGIVGAIEKLLVHLNYYKAAKLVDSAREFYAAFSAFDDFCIEVRAASQKVYIPIPCFFGPIDC